MSSPSRLFEARYELVQEIGRGSMGIVYKAIDHTLDEVIAIKVLARTGHAGAIDRLKHEVKVARRLTHPSICRLHDLIELRGQMCLSMEFIEGLSLRDVLASGAMSFERTTRHLLALASALELAHGEAIVHRDLKPANVIVDDDDEPHILDFGIAQSDWLEDGSAPDLVVGTPAYMAPEQWKGGSSVDARADLYSLGVMLYQMVCGRTPFAFRGSNEVMRMHQTRVPSRPREVAGDVPLELDRMIMRLLEKDPARRPQTAEHVAAEVEAWIGGPGASGPREARAGASDSALAAVGRVLVADRDRTSRAALRGRLEGLGLEVSEAADGATAIELAFGLRPDLMLLDVGMPFLDGLQVCRLIRNNARTRDVAVVLMGNAFDDLTLAISAQLGATAVLPRPIAESALEEVVAEALAGVAVPAGGRG